MGTSRKIKAECERSSSMSSAPASMASSINEMLRSCNPVRQATPEGHMLQILQEALNLENFQPSIQSTPQGQFLHEVQAALKADDPNCDSKGPDAEELVARLQQLPEEMRSKLYSMLEEAELANGTSA